MEAQSTEERYHSDSHNALNRKLRVLLDARKLGDGGIGVYIHNLIVGLLESDKVELTLITSRERRTFLRGIKGFSVIEDNAKSYSFDEMLGLARRIDMSEFDIFHVPHYTLPYNIGIPSVVTIHDVIHVTHPERSFYPIIAKFLIRSALKRASKVITVSESSKRALCNLLGKESSKIEVIPNAIDPKMNSVRDITEPLATKFGLVNEEYILGVFSNLKPHKGVTDLLRSFQKVRSEYPGIKLALAGSGIPDPEYLAKVLKGVTDFTDVNFLGTVSRDELSHLYAGALFLVVPSLAEGFSLPVLEAKFQGTPIVCRPVPAIKELIDENDICCSDFSQKSLTTGLLEGLKKYRTRDRGDEILIDIERYSTPHVTKEILTLYRDAIKTSKTGDPL